MKVYVLTDETGAIVGSIRSVEQGETEDGPYGGQPTPEQGQQVHELDLPDDLREMMKTPEEFHQELRKHIRADR
jgi:hypothetical protein